MDAGKSHKIECSIYIPREIIEIKERKSKESMSDPAQSNDISDMSSAFEHSSGNSSSNNSTQSVAKSASNNPLKWLEDMQHDVKEIIDLTIEQRKEALDFSKKRNQMELDHSERKFNESENKKKRLALEEKRIEVERLRLEREIIIVK